MPIILIVDDERENLLALRLALGDENPSWLILTAQNEAAGMQLFRDQLARQEPVDVVLTDLVMETESSGMNVLRQAQELDPTVMAILFTAKEKSLDRYAALDYGAFDVVEKNIRGISAVREINIKTRAALRYRAWSQKINYLRRYFDPKVFDTIEREPSLLNVARKMVTIVFWDIRGFSKLCETLKGHPTLIAQFLQEYCAMGAETVFSGNGVLDKFIGDGIMALYGVLNHQDDAGKNDAFQAVQTAQKFRLEFPKLLERWVPEWNLYVADKIDIGLGCGIHTGEVIVGNVGTRFRDQFTALGPPVNLASRIESRAQPGQILLSQSTAIRIRDAIQTRPAGEIADIKNIPGKFDLFEVVF